jgi:hypothetical protein
MAHVVGDEHRGLVRVLAGQFDAVAAVELDVLVTQRVLGQLVELPQARRELGVGTDRVVTRGPAPQGRFFELLLHAGEEPEVVGGGRGRAFAHQGARQREPGAGLTEGGRVLLHPRHLGVGERVPTELEHDHELADPAPVRGFGHRRRGPGRIERREGRQVEVGASPVPGDDGTEHGPLLVGRAAVDVDHAEEHSGDGLHHGVFDHAGHGGTLARSTGGA